MKKFMLAIGSLASAAIPAAVTLSCANKTQAVIVHDAVNLGPGTHSNIKDPRSKVQNYIVTHPVGIPASIIPFVELLDGNNYVIDPAVDSDLKVLIERYMTARIEYRQTQTLHDAMTKFQELFDLAQRLRPAVEAAMSRDVVVRPTVK